MKRDLEIYNQNAIDCSTVTTKNYSTSFSWGIRLFKPKYRRPIYAIYGFVRFADEIVDSFHDFDKKALFKEFEKDTWHAIENRISSNPILQSFQWVVNEYRIDHDLIKAFLHSMEMDLHMNNYTETTFKEYVYGSAEVVGLMCLRIFYKEDDEQYQQLLPPARKLGEVFQKINFLRDIRADYKDKGRIYFPEVDFDNFTIEVKQKLEADISQDFDAAYPGIKSLKKDVRLGVLLAYIYYRELLRKIQKTSPKEILNKRYRVSNPKKLLLLLKAQFMHRTGLL